MKVEVSLPVAGLTYQVAENVQGFSVLSRIPEEVSANSYGQRDLSRSLPLVGFWVYASSVDSL